MRNTGTVYLIPTSLNKRPLKEVLLKKDITIVQNLKYFIVETPKTARAHLKGLDIVLQELDMRVLDEHSKRKDLPFLLEPLIQGHDIGLMSDAGTPAVADPGSMVVRECHRLGIRIVPMVGPSSILLALMASGLNGQSFRFHGYLPRDPEKRKRKIKSIENDSTRMKESQIFMEAPYRNKTLFKDIIQVCKPSTDLCIAVDITGENEYINTMSIERWRESKKINILDIPTIFILLAKRV